PHREALHPRPLHGRQAPARGAGAREGPPETAASRGRPRDQAVGGGGQAKSARAKRRVEGRGEGLSMARLNFLLLAVAVACALAVITSQHRARRLFSELEGAQATTQKLNEEWTQLQLEQGTWEIGRAHV